MGLAPPTLACDLEPARNCRMVRTIEHHGEDPARALPVHHAFKKTKVMEPLIARNLTHLLSLSARAMQTREEIIL